MDARGSRSDWRGWMLDHHRWNIGNGWKDRDGQEARRQSVRSRMTGWSRTKSSTEEMAQTMDEFGIT